MNRGRIFREAKIRWDARQLIYGGHYICHLAGGCFGGVCLGKADHLGTNP